MTSYDSFWEWLFSRASLNLISLLGSVVAFVWIAAAAWKRLPLDGPYFSGLFVLSLCPLILCAADALIDLHIRIQGDWSPDYIAAYVSRDLRVALFGSSLSMVAVIIYSLAYLSDRKRRARQLPSAIPA